MSARRKATLDRREVVAAILKQRGDALVVAGLGAPCFDVMACGDNPLNFYTWGAMGGTAMIGLGLALAQPKRRVLVITGDADLLMSLGSLATVATQQPDNLAIVVLDNEKFAETGKQRGLTSSRVDIAHVAKGFGIKTAMTVTEQGAVGELAELLFKTPGPVLAVAKIAITQDPWALPVKDGGDIAHRFRIALGLEKA